MKFQDVEIGGKLRPVRFSYAALYEYERNTGRNAIADFAKLETDGISVVTATDLLFAGLSLGARSKGKEVEFTVHDVADWAFESPDAITKAMEAFAESFPKNGPAPEDDGGEKKAKPQAGTS